MNTIIKNIKEKVIPILQYHGIKKAGLFGSAVRDELNENSDIDILVEIKQDISLLDFIGIKLELEDAIGKKVDLVEYNCIKEQLKDYIVREQVKIL